MIFARDCKINKARVFDALGYGYAVPDAQTVSRLCKAVEMAEYTAAPRWKYLRIPIESKATLQGGIVLPGQDIAAHLEGCEACYLLALTLGAGIEREIRAAETSDMAYAVLLDISASVLTEQYADVAEDVLNGLVATESLYITGRFSPGYGDLPVSLQRNLLDLLDAGRSIGLTANEKHILTPRKSLTAILGIASHPVTGRLAGCQHCSMRGKCDFHLYEGRSLCGKTRTKRERKESDE